jgi:hypothetical protein
LESDKGRVERAWPRGQDVHSARADDRGGVPENSLSVAITVSQGERVNLFIPPF